MTAWWFAQVGVAAAMTLIPAAVMARSWMTVPCPDALWHRVMVATCYTAPCLVQFGAIVAIIDMPWPSR